MRAARLGLEPVRLGGKRGARRDACFWRAGRSLKKAGETFDCVSAIGHLRAEAVRGDDELGLFRQSRPGDRSQLRPDRRGQRSNRVRGKAKLNAAAALLTFCPPGPTARMKLSVMSRSSMERPSVMQIMVRRRCVAGADQSSPL
jgi:hypothetical protein